VQLTIGDAKARGASWCKVRAANQLLPGTACRNDDGSRWPNRVQRDRWAHSADLRERQKCRPELVPDRISWVSTPCPLGSEARRVLLLMAGRLRVGPARCGLWPPFSFTSLDPDRRRTYQSDVFGSRNAPMTGTGVHRVSGLHGRICQIGRTGVAWLDEAGTNHVALRLSRSLGLPAPRPDILGLALRIPTQPGQFGDLLLATTGTGHVGRYVLLPTRRHSLRAYTSLFPYRTLAGPRCWQRFRPRAVRDCTSWPTPG
jgi:hypothetical protein